MRRQIIMPEKRSQTSISKGSFEMIRQELEKRNLIGFSIEFTKVEEDTRV